MAIDAAGNQLLKPTGVLILGGAGWIATPGPISLGPANISEGIAAADDGTTIISQTASSGGTFGCVIESGTATPWPLPGYPESGVDPAPLHTIRVRLRVDDALLRNEATLKAAHPSDPDGLTLLVGYFDGTLAALLFTTPLKIPYDDVLTPAWRTYETTLVPDQVKLIRDIGYVNLWWTVRWQQTTTADPFDANLMVSITATDLFIANPILATRSGTQVAVSALRASDPTNALRVSGNGFQVAAGVIDPTLLPVRATRHGVQVAAARELETLRQTRHGIQVAVEHILAGGGLEIENRISRHSVQVAVAAIEDDFVFPIGFGTLVPSLFKHNYVFSTQTITRWSTSFSEAVGSATGALAQERISYLDRPIRTVIMTITGLSHKAVAEIEGEIRQRASAAQPAPLISDRDFVTVAGTGSTIQVEDTDTRRFFLGALIAIVSPAFGGKGGIVDIVAITALPGNGIIHVDSLVVSTVGDHVYPLINADVTFQVNTGKLTAHTTEVRLEFTEIPGKSAYPGTANTTPEFMEFFDGHPIFKSKINWRDGIGYEVIATGAQLISGQAHHTTIEGERARGRHGLPITALSRADAWEVIQFFDWCRGRARAFWHVSVEQTVRLQSMFNANTALLEKDQTLSWLTQNIGNITLAFTYRDGSLEYAKPTAILDLGSAFGVGLDRPVTTTDLLRIEPMYLCHWEKDSITENWGPPDVMETQLDAMEILAEADSPLTDDQTTTTLDK